MWINIFVLFERVAKTLNWPKYVWPLLLQYVFSGKAQEAYASLCFSLDYEKVKAAVLRAFELVPEAYRQWFGQSFVEFGHEKEVPFDRLCMAQNVKTFEQLRDLIVLEELKNCVPEKIATHINKQKVTKVSGAAVLADEYVLTHQDSFGKFSQLPQRSFSFPCSPKSSCESEMHSRDNGALRERTFCAYCKKLGHTIGSCFLLNKKNKSLKMVG